MTITYPNGMKIEGIVLARTEEWIRVALRGCRDSVEFLAGPDGSWYAESGEPVRFGEPAPQTTTSECLDEFLCPQELISRLVAGPDVIVGYPCAAVM